MSPQQLKILLDTIVERQDRRREVKVLRRQLRDHGTFGYVRESMCRNRAGWATTADARTAAVGAGVR